MENRNTIHRDISWLSFNERVLQEAENNDVPVYERLKFLAIFSSNLDEFYRVRVSELRQFKKLQKDIRKKLEEKPKKVIKEIQRIVDELQERFGKVFKEEIIPDLEMQGIFLIEKEDFTPEQQQYANKVFKEQLLEHVEVHHIKEGDEYSFLEDKSLFLFLDAMGQDVLITIPSNKVSRFVLLPNAEDKFTVTFIDEIIKANLSEIDPIFENQEAYCVKITRDAELYFDEYEGELVKLIKENLSQRKAGIPTRMLYDQKMPKALIKRLRKKMQLNKTDLMPGGKFHNFSDFFAFPAPEDNLLLNYDEMPPLPHHILEHQESLIACVQKQDVLLSFPYQKFDYIPNLIEEAAKANEIHSVNITLYRVSKDSAVAKALLKCLENGKKVTVFIEAKARFDEANNILWGERLKEKGANVLYSMPKIKVHSKVFLLEGEDFNIGYIGTGNFNEKSAKLYTDFGLLTSNKEITSELKNIFKFLNKPVSIDEPKVLWVSPFTTRTAIYSKIDNEIQLAKAGQEASLFFKMNSLEDEAMINKLYEASNAGVSIKLIVRGICRLKPGITGLSENIEARSIVGRFLEHTRIYCFGNDGNEEVYIASADCMTRNLDKRIEVGVSVTEPQLKQILKTCLVLQWSDNTKARILDAEQLNKFYTNDMQLSNAQEDFYQYLKRGVFSEA